jgi:photosystem II stability/assembly factor-like uncharacterized protein
MTSRSSRFPLALALLFGVISTLHAGPGVWTSTGPEGGNAVDIVVDPAAPATIYLNGANRSLYKSNDVGATWTALNVAPYVAWFTRLRMDPANGNRLLVTDGLRVFRTIDAGVSWAPLSGGLPVPTLVYDIGFDPHTADRIWIASADGLHVSHNGGHAWAIQPTSGFTGRLQRLAVDPHVASRLFGYVVDEIGGTEGLYRSTDAGASWSAASGLGPVATNALLFPERMAIAFTATLGTILLGANDNEVFRSVDGGTSFSSAGTVSLPNARFIRALHGHPTLSDTWYVGMDTGLARTTDGGVTYAAIGQGIQPSAGGYSNGVSALFIDPAAPGSIYAGAHYTGFYVTTDGGVNWLRRNNGLRQSAIRALAVHPAQPQWVYAGYGDAFGTPSDGLFRSVDRGSSWFTASPTLAASGLRDIIFDPNTLAVPTSATMYAAGYGAPLFSLDGSIRDGNAGIYKSTDSGVSWTTIDNGIPGFDAGGYHMSYFSTARDVVVDPASGSGPGGTGPVQTLYLAGSGTIAYDFATGSPTVRAARIYKSTNAGTSWKPSDSGLPIPTYDTVTHFAHRVQVISLTLNPSDPDTLYAGTFVSVGNGMPEPLISQGVVNGAFKSIDGGATWTHSSNGLPRLLPGDPDSPHRNVLALALAPSAPDTLYAAVNRELFDARIYKSTDGGTSWNEASAGIAAGTDIRALIVDPDDADIAYAGATGTETNPGGVYRTIDGGVTWTSYSIGLPATASLALNLDKSGAVPRLYAGTQHGVFDIDQVPDEDSDGVPTTTEASAPSGGDGNGDGIPDTVQPRVASLPGVGEPLRGGTDYVSIELVPVSGTCSRLENTHALPADRFPPDPGREAAFGFVRMDIGDCEQAQLELTYHGANFDPSWVFRIYAPLAPEQTYSYAWRDFPFARVGNLWTITVTDNAFGDLRAADGAILFQGGVVRSEVIFANGFESGEF